MDAVGSIEEREEEELEGAERSVRGNQEGRCRSCSEDRLPEVFEELGRHVIVVFVRLRRSDVVFGACLELMRGLRPEVPHCCLVLRSGQVVSVFAMLFSD